MPNVASSARFFTQQTSLPLSAISDNAYLFLDVHQRRLRPRSVNWPFSSFQGTAAA